MRLTDVILVTLGACGVAMIIGFVIAMVVWRK